MSSTPTALLLVTGDELLRGFVQEANAATVARDLRDHDIDLVSIRVVGDAPGVLGDAVDDALAQGTDLVVITGGLGPTHDDRTSEIVAASAGVGLELREDALAIVEARVRAYGRMRTQEEFEVFDPGNRKQATLPTGATWFEPMGTAPGYALAAASGTVLVVLPGPPGEMRHAWRAALAGDDVRRIVERAPKRHERVVRAWGVPESRASQLLARLGHEDSDGRRVTLCARDGELELSVRGDDAAAIDELVEELVDALGEAIFAVDDERAVEQIVGDLLVGRGLVLGTAESCTGGMIGAALTGPAGSSAWYAGSIVAYANDVKLHRLGVSDATLERDGAVSEAAAREMAAGALDALGVDVAVSVTGIAGPGGGSEEKPVGTVHLAVAVRDGSVQRTAHRSLRMPGDRATIRRRSTGIALHFVRQVLGDPGLLDAEV